MKNFSVSKKIHFNRAVSYVSLVLLAIFFIFAISTNFFGNVSKTKAVDLANGTVITKSNSSYDNQSINIPSGTTVQIDGEHTFANLTIKNGGTLTSADYNKYGVYNESDLSQNADKLFHNNNSNRYALVVRGFINTGTDHDNTYRVTSGIWEGNDPADKLYPNSLYADDYAALELFAPVEADDYNASYWAAPVAHAYSDYDGTNTSYTDNISDAAHPYIPFELRYVNKFGATNFGITSCNATCGTRANNKFIKMVSSSTSFTSSATAELKTRVAWQGDADNSFASITSYATLNTFFSSRFDVGYNTYYKAEPYDYSQDKRCFLENNSEILSNPTINTNSIDQYENVNTVGSNYRGYAHFYPTYERVSPLASRRTEHSSDEEGNAEQGYPIISKALYETFRNNSGIIKPTVLTITGDFTIEDGGSIDLDGRGFDASAVYAGSGPGGGKDYNGASHSGLGGCQYNGINWVCNQTAIYDSTMAEPTLPGSGIYYGNNNQPGRTIISNSKHFWYGGGYIKIVAIKKITLQEGSMISANGVGGSAENPSPGPSGGSIILIDSDASSIYNSLIMAMGGYCHDADGGPCQQGGGGGGYIFISSKSDLSYLEGRKNYYQAFPDPTVGSISGRNPTSEWTYNDWTSPTGVIKMPSLFLNVAGGISQNDTSLSRGQHGIINISGGSSAYKLKKSLEAVERPAGTPDTKFNPYALQLGDVIKVVIEAEGIASGSKVRDYALKVPNKNFQCKPNAASLLPAGGTTGVESGLEYVEWTATGNNIDFSYLCNVQ